MIRMRMVLCGLLALMLALTQADANEARRVLLLHSFGSDHSPWSDIAASLRNELVRQAPHPIDLYEASVFTARFQNTAEEKPFDEYLRGVFAERELDLVVAIGATAGYFVLRHSA